jgi:hypothetical protein
LSWCLKFIACSLIHRWPIGNEQKKKAQTFPKNGIKGGINIFEVKAFSSGNHMNVSDHVYIVHCSRYIRSFYTVFRENLGFFLLFVSNWPSVYLVVVSFILVVK